MATSTPTFPPVTHRSSSSATLSPPPPPALLLLPQPAAVEPAAKAPAMKRRKCWYAAKKNERSELEEQIRKLTEHKQLLQLPPATRERALRQLQQENVRLRHAVRGLRQQSFPRAQSALSDGARTQGTPLARHIHLSADAEERAATFRALKNCMALDTERYILERMRFLDPTAEYAHWSEFTLPNGDFCYHVIDVIPLPSYTSVRQVFERMHEFFFNMEIAWTEKSGELMVRQGEFETSEQEVATQRFLTVTASGVHVETNTLHVSMLRSGFPEVREDGSVGDVAVLAIASVDEDDLYPYVPTERVRQDITGGMVVYFAQMHKSGLTIDPTGAIFGRNFCSRTMLGLD